MAFENDLWLITQEYKNKRNTTSSYPAIRTPFKKSSKSNYKPAPSPIQKESNFDNSTSNQRCGFISM